MCWVFWLIFALGIAAGIHGFYRLIRWKVYADVAEGMGRIEEGLRLILEESGEAKGELYAAVSSNEGLVTLAYVWYVSSRERLGKRLGLQDLRVAGLVVAKIGEHLENARAIGDTVNEFVVDGEVKPGVWVPQEIWDTEREVRRVLSRGVAACAEQVRMKERRVATEVLLAATSFALGGLIVGLYGLFR